MVEHEFKKLKALGFLIFLFFHRSFCFFFPQCFAFTFLFNNFHTKKLNYMGSKLFFYVKFHSINTKKTYVQGSSCNAQTEQLLYKISIKWLLIRNGFNSSAIHRQPTPNHLLYNLKPVTIYLWQNLENIHKFLSAQIV